MTGLQGGGEIIATTTPAAKVLLAQLAQLSTPPQSPGHGGSRENSKVASSPRQQQKPRNSSAPAGGRRSSRRHAGERRGSGGGPVPRQEDDLAGNSEWHGRTLFSGSHCATNMAMKRGFACTFRRPVSSRAEKHSRPVFVVGRDGTDPRMCVDTGNPRRFTTQEKACYDKAWRQSASAPIQQDGLHSAGGSSRGSRGGGRSAAPPAARMPPQRPSSAASRATMSQVNSLPSAGSRAVGCGRPPSGMDAPRRPASCLSMNAPVGHSIPPPASWTPCSAR
eukprot:gnl/TRDRNA2_/TRDRNA2_86526_c0_seq1.p1 gnl/TRDRNA2_/TRDRNA2_86526_c0~~gnl/TRDRNA2_/TRDRNA2_86526_c0_seq1.p1  ORF type:complete len:294 (-),score=35.97 gnl/TRDRNA2_/TRDRNA2_86526_c0_seq1:105-938(-)